jgi:hypothetical protein
MALKWDDLSKEEQQAVRRMANGPYLMLDDGNGQPSKGARARGTEARWDRAEQSWAGSLPITPR